MTDLDLLRPDVLTAQIRAGIDRYVASLARHADARARLDEARAALLAAAHDNDPEEVTEVASAVREAEIVLESCPLPELDSETAARIRDVVQRVDRKFLDDVCTPHRRTFIEERSRMAPARLALRLAFDKWSPTGSPAEAGITLLHMASEFADAIDTYLVTAEPEILPEDALVRQAPRRVLEFIDLSLR